MSLQNLLLTPFRLFFRAPVLQTPFSTLKIPPISFLMSITFISFCVITSGTIFCFVRGIGMIGYTRNRENQVVTTWIDSQGVSSQFGIEGWVAALMFSLSAVSFIAAIVVLRKPKDEELTDLEESMRRFAFSCPFWCVMSYLIFSAKVGSFRPKFHV
jgi:hypothetical protein